MDFYEINLSAVTIEDCLVNYFYKNITVVLNDGEVIGFD